MSDRSSDYYLDPYRAACRRVGPQFDSTLWANRRSQQRRFAVIARMAMLAGRTVLDAGCGRGDFAEYLIASDVPFYRFIGVDAMPELIDYARQKNYRGCEFVLGDFVKDPSLLRTGDPQVIAMSGSLNTMDDATVFRVLEAAWAAAGETLVFNFLPDTAHKRAPVQGGPVRRFDTMHLLSWAMEKTWAVQFRQDYFTYGHDATIMMRKP